MVDSTDTAESVVVEHGPRTDLAVMLAVWPTLVLALSGLLYADLVAKGRIDLFSTAAQLGGLYVLTIGLVSLAYAATTTERVELDENGIRRYRLGQSLGPERWLTRVVRWEWLDPTPRGAIGLGFVHFCVHQPGGPLEWFRLTVSPQQARAILSNPYCPKSPLDVQTRQRLGIDSTSAHRPVAEPSSRPPTETEPVPAEGRGSIDPRRRGSPTLPAGREEVSGGRRLRWSR
jgi:hypothetical protein